MPKHLQRAPQRFTVDEFFSEDAGLPGTRRPARVPSS